jgi:hypothetical protein
MLGGCGVRTTFDAGRAPEASSTRSRPEYWRERIILEVALSTAVVHDLRNFLGRVFAGTEMLMERVWKATADVILDKVRRCKELNGMAHLTAAAPSPR